MKLIEKDKNTILLAALAARPADFDGFRDWVVSLVQAIVNAEIAEGKADVSVPVPHYVPASARNGHSPRSPGYQEPSLL
jgi:hypothetical protein